MFRLWRVTTFGVFFLAFLLFWIFVIGISSDLPGSYFNTGHNAVWIGHKWVGEPKSDAEIQELVSDLKKHQIDTVFVHSGPFLPDGNIEPETYKYAINFVETAKKFDPEIKYQAWLGQLRGKIDLSLPEVRHNVAKQCMILGQLVGFDGIHMDIEPVWDGDMDFISTLEECHAILPEDKVFSVALAEFIPESFLWLVKNVKEYYNYNSEVNYKNVAEYADQIVVMTYDTSISSDWKYRWLVKEQTIRVTNLLKGKEVFIGIPAYEGEEGVFNSEVENVKNGLLGIIEGLNNFRSEKENFAGVAIYSYWELDDDEWKSYEDLWLK